MSLDLLVWTPERGIFPPSIGLVTSPIPRHYTSPLHLLHWKDCFHRRCFNHGSSWFPTIVSYNGDLNMVHDVYCRSRDFLVNLKVRVGQMRTCGSRRLLLDEWKTVQTR